MEKMREISSKVFVGGVAATILTLLPFPAFAEEEAEEEGVWSVVDENGVVTDAIICTESVCGEGGEFDQMGGFPGGELVYQQPGHSGFADNGYIDVEYNEEIESYEISEPLIVEDQEAGRQTTIVPKGQGELETSPKTIVPETVFPDSEVEVVDPEEKSEEQELPVSADIEIATGFLDKDSNYVEVEIETSERSLFLEYLNEQNAINSLERDVLGKESDPETETVIEKTPMEKFVESVVGLIKNIFNV